ncbi:hypothetical protein DH2020_022106 [Rehmannia glutinosa]|uniref:Plastocyanin-like domain-containing protein n=1 Tax=Rehmannia glutinosa TaxID=99300 RepID=A0ABR0WEQ1_REHGL
METPITIDNTSATATLHYIGTAASTPTVLTDPPPHNATTVVTNFTDSLRSLNSNIYPLWHLPHWLPRGGRHKQRHIVLPNTISLLNAHFFNISGVFTDDFPGNPHIPYDYTGKQPSNLKTITGTKVYRLTYNSTVQLVLQGTGMILPENHPIHLHGHNFFVIGNGLGNFDPNKDPKNFNLVDPVERNTVAVPSGGWLDGSSLLDLLDLRTQRPSPSPNNPAILSPILRDDYRVDTGLAKLGGIEMMALMSTSVKNCRSLSMFHVELVTSISSLTFISSISRRGAVIGLNVSAWGWGILHGIGVGSVSALGWGILHGIGVGMARGHEVS